MADKQPVNMTIPKHKSWPVRVALVSSNHLARVGLQGILQNIPGIDLIGESYGGAHAYTLIQEMKPDCVIIDLESNRNPLASIQYYKQLSPQTRVLLFADWNDIEHARSAISMGAEGIVLKCQPVSVLLAMIEDKKEDSSSIAIDVPEVQSAGDDSNQKPHVQKAPIDQIASVDSLTERERSVIALVAQGLSNRDISDRLSISDITVRHHLTRIFDKLGVANRQKLLIIAHHLGLVDLRDPAQLSADHSSFGLASSTPTQDDTDSEPSDMNLYRRRISDIRANRTVGENMIERRVP
jgi:DNA-binding NarL/FixJ family response regulator